MSSSFITTSLLAAMLALPLVSGFCFENVQAVGCGVAVRPLTTAHFLTPATSGLPVQSQGDCARFCFDTKDCGGFIFAPVGSSDTVCQPFSGKSSDSTVPELLSPLRVFDKGCYNCPLQTSSTSVASSSSTTSTSSSASSTASSPSTSSAVALPVENGTSTFQSSTVTASPSSTLYTTSTIYATSTFTISSCAPTITACPYGSVTTVTIAVSTTICPVSTIGGGAVPKPVYHVATGGVVAVGTGAVLSPTSTPSPVPADFKGSASGLSFEWKGVGMAVVAGLVGVFVL